MKKFLALMMTLLMVLGLAACGDGGNTDATPYEIVQQASEKLNNADGVAYSMEMGMKMSDPESDENSIDMAMTGDIKMQKVSENDYKLAYHMVTNVSAIDEAMGKVEMDMYYAAGYMYYDMSQLGITYKIAMDMTEAMEYMNSANFDEIEADMVKEQSIKADGTGQVVNMILDGTKMTDMVKSMSEEFAALGEDDAMTIGDIPYTVYLDENGDITNIEMVMEFSMEAEGMMMNMSMDTKMAVEQIGGVTVELPENLADYQELSLDGEDLDAAA